MATATLPKPGAVLHKGDRVRAAVGLPRVPKGTAGTVSMVLGVSWVRYWVHFDNGEWVATIGRDKLENDADVEVAQAHASAPVAPVTAEPVTAAAVDTAPDPARDAPPAPKKAIPAHLLERSKAGRARTTDKASDTGDPATTPDAAPQAPAADSAPASAPATKKEIPAHLLERSKAGRARNTDKASDAGDPATTPDAAPQAPAADSAPASAPATKKEIPAHLLERSKAGRARNTDKASDAGDPATTPDAAPQAPAADSAPASAPATKKEIPAHLLERSKAGRARNTDKASSAGERPTPAPDASPAEPPAAVSEAPAEPDAGTVPAAPKKAIPAHLLERSQARRARTADTHDEP